MSRKYQWIFLPSKTTKRTTALHLMNFIKEQKKMYPYIQVKNGAQYHYAICPECKNPVRIINLLKKEYSEKITNRTRTHARHCISSVKDIAVFNRPAYQNCSLHTPQALSLNKRNTKSPYNEKIKDLLENNIQKIGKFIQKITGINFSKQKIDELCSTFIKSKNYEYQGITCYNIPYAILFTAEAIMASGQFISKSQLGDEIKQTLQCAEKIPGHGTIYLTFSKHSINTIPQTIIMQLFSKNIDHSQSIFEKKIFMEPCLYD